MYLVIFNIGHLSVYGRQAFKNKLGGIQFMQKHKRLFSLLIALAMILSLLPVMASAAETTTIYLNPGVWKTASAWYDIWHWGSSSSGAWATAVDSDGDGVYEITIPADTTGLIILRKDPSSTEHSWECWNRQDLTYDGTYNCYTVTDWSAGSWGTYVYTEPEIALPGSFNTWDTTNLMTVENGVGNITMDLAAGVYTFKIVKAGSWLGCSTTINDSTEGTVFSSTGGDCTLNATGGSYTFTFVAATNTLTISCVSSGTDTDPVVEPEYTSPNIEGGSVTFNYWTSIAVESVEVSGSMNNWKTGSYPMTKDEETGIWSVTISDLYNGTYEYKIVVDGAWLVDPKNENIADSGNSYFEITESTDKPVVVRTATLHFQDTLSWGGVYAHIWNAGDYGTTWPGTAMTAEAGYTGWYSMTTTVSTETISLIFNNGTGGEGYQTANLSITEIPESDCEYWFVPTSADVWYEGSFVTAEPETYVKEETASCQVTLHFKNTLAWDGVNGYAWTNTWPAAYPAEAWPGTALTEDGNWYTISFDATYVVGDGVYAIFNTVTGTDDYGYTTYAQTADLYIDCTDLESVEKWIIPTGTQTDYLSYECDIYDEEPIETAQVNGVAYYTLAEAIANADGSMITLVGDNYVATTIEADVTIDLAGYKLDEITVADGYSLTLIDSANDDYVTFGGVAYVKGTVNPLASVDGKNYVTVVNEYGQISAHRYDVEITHISLKPADDALGFKAQLIGDSYVQAAVTGFGFEMSVAGGQPKTFTKNEGLTDGTFTLRLKNIMANNGGEMEITASAFVIFGEEQSWNSGEQTTTMKETIQLVDAAWSTYSETQQTAVKTLLNTYYSVTQHWDLENIFLTIDIPITQ